MQDLKIKDDAVNFKVRNDSGTTIPTKVSINGIDVRCRSIDYHADIESVPTCTVELLTLGDIEVNHADILFRFTPDTVENAIKILRHELMVRGDLYDSFAASIESSVREQGLQLPFQPTREVAEKILDRVIGVESNV